ncbi:MAG: DNA polymerase III subunit delta [candidate division NC10 bacterium]|nr:DNA polymerase III subunit delta [candidate division NC10 bacterium]
MAMERRKSQGKLPSLYLLDGEEGPLKDEILHSLVLERFPSEHRELNLEVFDGRETGAEEILLRAATLPFLSPLRVMVVREADRLSSSDLERILDHLKAEGSPHVCFIFLTRKIDRRGAFFRFLQREGRVISCSASGAQEVGEWLRRWAARKGKRITPAAIQALYEGWGDEVNLLWGELEKVILRVGERKEIGEEDVLSPGGETRHHIFQVVEDLGYGRIERALLGIRSLLESGEDPLPLLGMISRHFRLLAKVKEMASQGKSEAEMGGKLKIPAHYLQSLLFHSSSVTDQSLERAFRDLLGADLLLKSEKRLGTFALEKLLVSRGKGLG